MPNNPFSIALDTCIGEGSLALISGDELVAEREGLRGRGGRPDVVNALSLFIRENRASAQDLETLYVTRGPGSFTGVRTGLSVAKGLSSVFSLKVAACTVMDAMNVLCGAERCFTVIFAGRGQVAYRLCRGDGKRIVNEPQIAHSICSNEEFIEIAAAEGISKVIAEPRLSCPDGASFKDLLAANDITLSSSGGNIATLAWKFLRDNPPELPEPMYTRDFEAGVGR